MDERSTTLSARLTDEPRDVRLVEVDLRGLSGSSIVGRRVRLEFTAKLTYLADDSHAAKKPMFELWGDVTVAQSRGLPPREVGRMHLSEPLFVERNQNEDRWTRSTRFWLELDRRQMDELEELRAGDGLVFATRPYGSIHLQEAVRRLNPAGELFYAVNQSDWLRLLNQVQYGRFVSVEVPLPRPGEYRGELATAVESLHEAVEALRRGADEEAVADCRDALEALTRAAGGKPQAAWNDQSLTKDERFVYVQVILRSIANLAHHNRDKAAASGAARVTWDRADAQAIIVMLAALIRRLGSRA